MQSVFLPAFALQAVPWFALDSWYSCPMQTRAPLAQVLGDTQIAFDTQSA